MRTLVFLLAGLILTGMIVVPTGSNIKAQAAQNHARDIVSSMVRVEQALPVGEMETSTSALTISSDGNLAGTADLTHYEVTASNGTKFSKTIINYRPYDQSEYGIILQSPLLKRRDGSRLQCGFTNRSGVLVEERPVRFVWDGNITFISTSSEPLFVRYDHMDNGPYANATYDIPPNAKYATLHQGQTVQIAHLPDWLVDEIRAIGLAAEAIAGVLAEVLIKLLCFPEPVVTKAAVAVMALIALIFVIDGILIEWWVDNILRCEVDDGWMYMGGFGRLWCFYWLWISFGSWRDWHIPVLFIGPCWDEPYDGTKNPWTFYDTSRTRFMTVWYMFSEERGIWREVKIGSIVSSREEKISPW